MKDLVVFGVGQLGQLFGAAGLRLGYRVTPILRDTPSDVVFRAVPAGTPIFLCMAEADLAAAVAELPASRRPDAVLVQNELFPAQWAALGLQSPTLLTIWLSKKKQRPIEVARASSAYGPHAALGVRLLQALDLPAVLLDDLPALHQEIVAKFTFILTINALGLVENLTLGEWLAQDRDRVTALMEEARLLGEAHLGHEVDAVALRAAVLEAMEGLRDYPARGRSAVARLARALADARRYGLDLPRLAAAGGAPAAETASPSR